MTLCECGCGKEVLKEGNRFIHGHHGKSHMWNDEARKNQSEKNKGKKYSLGHKQTKEHKRKIGEGNRGKTQTESAKQKISEANKGKNLGEKSGLWKGGISFEPYCPKFNYDFKESIREKFGRVCFMCGAPENGRKLSVHHVNYDKSCLCSEIECEFVPLCASCHSKTSNGDREYWESLILDILATYK